MDIEAEFDILIMYRGWLAANKYDAEVSVDLERDGWLDALRDELRIDENEVDVECWEQGMKLEKRGNGDGEWIVLKWIFAHYEGGKVIRAH